MSNKLCENCAIDHWPSACPYFGHGKPVPGWTATPVEMYTDPMNPLYSHMIYVVEKCPMYVKPKKPRPVEIRKKKPMQMISIGGVEKSLMAWAKEYRIGYPTVKDRIARGQSVIDALTAPVKTYYQRTPVIATCIATGEVRTYSSFSKTNADGFNKTSVSLCACGKQASHKGWTFKRKV